jgi:pimeloyl-ACP methyl ester carboxylesterase
MNKTRQLETGFIETNGTHLYYEKIGTGRPLVLLHGGYMDRRLWDDQFVSFSEQYQVIRYDLRGFGKSALPQRLYSDRQDLYELLRSLGIQKACLLGLSIGGMISVDFALEWPDMVEALILVGTPLFGYPSTLLFSEQQLREEKELMAPFESAKQEGNISALVDAIMAHPTQAPHLPDSTARQRQRENLSESSFAWLLNPAPKEELTPPAYEQLTDIHIPTLIIVGANDHVQYHKGADTYEQDIPSARRVTIPEAYHLPNMEKPEEFNQIVLEFLNGLPDSHTNKE